MSQPDYLKTIEDRHSETSPKDKAGKSKGRTGYNKKKNETWTADRLVGNKESTKEDAELVDVRNKVYDTLNQHTETDRFDGFSVDTFNISDVGLCRRQLFLHKLGVAQPNKRLRGKYLTGSLVHRFLEDEIRDEIVFGEKEDAEFDKSVQFSEDGVTFKGRADMVNYSTGRVVDFRTRATWYGFDAPVMPDVDEVTALVRGLEGVDKSSMAYVNVKTFETREFPKGVGAGRYMDFSEDRWNHVLEKVKDVRDALAQRLDERERSDAVVSDFDDVPFPRCFDCELCGDEEDEVKAPDTHYRFDVTVGDVLQ